MTRSTIKQIAEFIETAENLLLCRDIDGLEGHFAPLWPDIDEPPDLSQFDIQSQASLLGVFGRFLSSAGRIKARKNYQERAKDLLTLSIEISTQLGDLYSVAKINAHLAVCYYYEGLFAECDSLLNSAELDFSGDRLHPSFLNLKVHRLITTIWRGETQTAMNLVDELLVPMEFCKDPRVQSLYYLESGLLYRSIGLGDKAEDCYHKAIQYAKATDNYLFVAINFNNLAFLHNWLGDYTRAHENADTAISIYRDRGFTGWLAGALDTKSLIFFKEGRYREALDTIEEAIKIFRKGDDAAGLIESLWNKVRYLIELHEKEEALMTFGELSREALDRIGDYGLRKFVKEFVKLFHGKGTGDLFSEIQRFKRFEIEDALAANNFDTELAADSLGIPEYKLTQIIDEEFKDLAERVSSRKDQASLTKKEHSDSSANTKGRKHITLLDIPQTAISFEDVLSRPETFSTYYFSAEQMQSSFEFPGDAVIAFVPVEGNSTKEPLLVYSKQDGTLHYSRISHDRSLDFYMLIDVETPLTLDDVEIIGRAFAYCSFEDLDKEPLIFQKLPRD